MNTHNGFTRKGWLLFGVMAIVWGLPYLFIKEAVDTYSPAAVVAGRTLIGGLVLLPFALRAGVLKEAWKLWPWVLVFGLVEMAAPFYLLSHAETQLTSGTTGLLVATVPLFSTLIALTRGDRSTLAPLRLLGLAIGFAGVGIVVAGPGLVPHEPGSAIAIGEVLLTALFYAIAPFVIATKLSHIPSLGTITIALFAIGIAYLPIAFLTSHEVPTPRSTVSLVLLGVICTALAFIVFFALIGEVGPVRAPLFTYINPIVAIALGAVLLAEPITSGLLLGFPVVLLGCWLAATGGRLAATVPIMPEPLIPETDQTELTDD